MALTSGRPSSPEGRGSSSSSSASAASAAGDFAVLIGSGDPQGSVILAAVNSGHVHTLKSLQKKLNKKGSSILKAVSALGNGVADRLLHIAAGSVQFEVCKFLIADLKMDVNAAGKQGGPPMISAIDAIDLTSTPHQIKNCQKIVELLIRRGASPNKARTGGFAPIHHATLKDSFEITKMLLANGAHVNATCHNENMDVSRLLLDHGSDPNMSGFTALHVVVIKDSLNIIEHLLDNGADVNAMCSKGSVLHVAAESSTSEAVVKLLLERGADPNLTNMIGYTALHVAANKDSHGIGKLLLRYEAHVDALCDQGSALLIATQRSSVEFVELLVFNGANLNITNSSGLSALHHAALTDSYDIAELLLLGEETAINSSCEEGTSLHIAARRGCFKLLRLLTERNASADICDTIGRKAIEVAAINGYRDCVAVLLLHTTCIDLYEDWSVDGIMRDAKTYYHV